RLWKLVSPERLYPGDCFASFRHAGALLLPELMTFLLQTNLPLRFAQCFVGGFVSWILTTYVRFGGQSLPPFAFTLVVRQKQHKSLCPRYSAGLEVTRQAAKCIYHDLFCSSYALRGCACWPCNIDGHGLTKHILVSHFEAPTSAARRRSRFAFTRLKYNV